MATVNVTKKGDDRSQDNFDKAKENAGDALQKGKEAAGHFASAAAGTASNLAATAVDKADKATEAAGSSVKGWGEALRESTPNEGMLGAASNAVAGTLESTGKYLEEKGVSGMAEDFTSLIRNHPITALVVGIGVGFLLARATAPRSY